jgi:hypothetical protein
MEAAELMVRLSRQPPAARVFIGRPDLEHVRYEVTEVTAETIDTADGEELVLMLNSSHASVLDEPATGSGDQHG